MIRFYGAPRSSAGRTHWLLEELGIPYEYRNMDGGKTRSPEFLALNPSGKVPFIEDGDLTLFESVAINFYLAEKYGGELWPADIRERALICQWSMWAMTNVQPILIDIMYHVALLPEAERDPKKAEQGREWMKPYLKVLEGGLVEHEYLVGGKFGIADIIVASVINLARPLGVALDEYPRTAAWLARLKERPAYRRAAAAE